MESFIIEKANNSIATRLQTNLLNNRNNIFDILVQETIQRLNCVVNYLNMKMKEKKFDRIDLQLFSSLK